MTAGQRLLILGAGGFLGTHLRPAASAAGLTPFPAFHRSRGDAVGCDLLDPASISACLERFRPDLIVNAAGAASVGRSWERPAESFALNATAVLNLLEAVAKQTPDAHVLCLSSADVYGVRETAELPLREDLEPRPVTPYGAGKVAMEALCGQYARSRGLSVAIARIFNLIGPGQSPRFAIPGFAHRVAAAELAGEGRVELGLGSPSASRDFLDVREGARILTEVSRRRLTGTYNLCSERGTTIGELVQLLAGQTAVEVVSRHDPALRRPADPPVLVGDPGRLREATGLSAETPLERSLGDLLDEARAVAAEA